MPRSFQRQRNKTWRLGSSATPSRLLDLEGVSASEEPRTSKNVELWHMGRLKLTKIGIHESLRTIDERLGTLAAAIPQPGPEFDLLEEFGVGVRCVRGDLLGDAIETLEVLAFVGDDGLCRRYEERQRLLDQHG